MNIRLLKLYVHLSCFSCNIQWVFWCPWLHPWNDLYFCFIYLSITFSSNDKKKNLRLLSCSAELHYIDVIMGAMASEITGDSIVYSTLCSGADQRKHQNSASLAGVRWIFPTKGQYSVKCFHLMTSSWIIWLLQYWLILSARRKKLASLGIPILFAENNSGRLRIFDIKGPVTTKWLLLYFLTC